MCVSPTTLRNGVIVGCRMCWQCLGNRVDDWVGRNLAEMQTSTRSYSVRLSYGRSHDGFADHLHSVMLFTSDMQKMLKRMRSKRFGYKVRYMIAGEYGGTFGRAHWHGIFHFTGNKLPDWDGAWSEWTDEQWQRVGGVHIPEWANEDGSPIGHVHIKRAQYAHLKYALKYMLKDQMDPMSSNKLIMSKYPPLGSEYLLQYAREIAEAGLAPRGLFYRFPVITAQGEQLLKQFMMRGKVAETFVQTYIARWEELYGDEPMPDHGPDVDIVHAYKRFGRLGRSEYLTQLATEDAEADKRFAAMEAEAMRPRTISEYFAERNSHVMRKPTFGLMEWEEKYFGKKEQQRQGARGAFDYNSPQILDYLLARYGLTEEQFWAKPYSDLEHLWSQARDGFRDAAERFKRTGSFAE